MTIVKRYELLFYKLLLKILTSGERKPAFGDYVIAHPQSISVDPRILKPAATIRYAIDGDAWYIAKGKNVRGGGKAQYKGFCNDLVKSVYFSGAPFSFGSEYIFRCAQGRINPGSLTTWRRVGTNQHLEKTVSELANLADS